MRSQRIVALQLQYAFGLKTADLNGDGRIDIAVAGARTTVGALHSAHKADPAFEVLLADDSQSDGFRHSGMVRIDLTDPGDPNDLKAGAGADLVTPILCPPQVGGRRDLLMSMIERETGDQQPILLKNTGTDASGNILWDIDRDQQGKNSFTLAFGKLRTGMDRRDVVLSGEVDGKAFWTMKQDNMSACPAYDVPNASEDGFNNGAGLDIGRVDLDTKQDVVVAYESIESGFGQGGCLALFKGIGDATFQTPPQLIRTGGLPPPDPDDPDQYKTCCPGPRVVRIVDMNDDGLNDLVATNYGGGSVVVILNAGLVAGGGD